MATSEVDDRGGPVPRLAEPDVSSVVESLELAGIAAVVSGWTRYDFFAGAQTAAGAYVFVAGDVRARGEVIDVLVGDGFVCAELDGGTVSVDLGPEWW